MGRNFAVYAFAVVMATVIMSATVRISAAEEAEHDFYELMRSGRAPEALDIAESLLFKPSSPVPAKPFNLPCIRYPGILDHIAFVGAAEPFIEGYRSEIRCHPDDLRLQADLVTLLYANRNSAEGDIELVRFFSQPEANTAHWHLFAAGILDGWNRPYERIRHLRRAAELPVTGEDISAHLTARVMSFDSLGVYVVQSRYFELADELMSNGEWAVALEYCRKAIAAGPKSASVAVEQEAKARAAIKDAESRISKLKKLSEQSMGGERHCLIKRADLLLSVGRLREATESYQSLVKDLSFSPHAHAGLGEAYARQGQTDEAITEYQAALDLMPVMESHPWLHVGPDITKRWMCRLEELCETAGKPEVMIGAYEKERSRLSIETAARPSLVRARIRLNLWHTTAFMLRNDRSADVVTLWSQWCKRFPDDAAKAIVAVVKRGLKLDEALAPFSLACADHEWQIGASIVTAAVFQASGQNADARVVLENISKNLDLTDPRRLIVADMLPGALSAAPIRDEIARLTVSDNAAFQANSEAALKALKPLMENPEVETSLRGKAIRLAWRLHLIRGENSAAVEAGEELLRLFPHDMNARRQRAYALAADGRPLEWWGIGQEEVERHQTQAERKAEAGDRLGALAIYRQLLNEARPSDGVLSIRAAKLYEDEHDEQNEFIWLQRARSIDLARYSPAGISTPNRLRKFYESRNDIKGLAALEARNRRENGGEAITLARYGCLNEALNLLEDLTADARDDYPSYLSRQALANLYIDSGRTDEARILCNSLFEHLVAMQKFDSGHGLALARALGRLGEYEKAIAMLDRTEQNRERNYADSIDDARDQLNALQRLTRPGPL